MIEIPNVRDIMTKKVVALHQGMTMEEAMRSLLKFKHSGAPVVDADNTLVGMLSEKDCLRMFFGGLYHRLPVGTVSQYMSVNITTCHPNDSLLAVAQIFFRQSFRRLPVLETDGRMIGIVSRSDVLMGSKRLWENGKRIERHDLESGYLTAEIQAALGTSRSPTTEEIRTDLYR